jgi:hypothetical protein
MGRFMMTKTLPTSAPTWAIVTPQLFTLSADESAIIEKHRQTWADFAAGGKPHHGDAIDAEWGNALNAAKHGDNDALALIEKFGSPAHFQRYRQAAEQGRTARFHIENAGNVRECRPMLERAKKRLEALLADYQTILAHPARAALGIPSSKGDEVTSRLEALLARIGELLEWEPKISRESGLRKTIENFSSRI